MPHCKVETSSASLVDVLDRVLDKGIVIDARLAVMVLGVRLVEIDTVVVVASLPRYVSLGRPLVRAPIAGRMERAEADTPMPDSRSSEVTESSNPARRLLARRRRRRARRRKMVLRRFLCAKGCSFHLAAPAAPHAAVVRCPYGLGVICPVSTV
jgi:hypothetical protein